MQIRIRKAVVTDVPALRALIEMSVRELQAQDYTPAQMEGGLETVFGVDSQLIADGTYFIAEARLVEAKHEEEKPSGGKNAGSEWVIAGCGGWSKRKTLYGSGHWLGRGAQARDPTKQP